MKPERGVPEAAPAAALLLLTLFAGVQASAWLSFALFGRLDAALVSVVVSAMLAAAGWALSRRSPPSAWLIAACATCVALGAAAVLHDFSHDGQQYHQQAILAMAEGWNPLGGRPYSGPHELWVNGYSKGVWIFSAALMNVFGSVELGKAVNLLMGIASGLAAYAACRHPGGMGRALAALLAFTAALNPVLGSQWPTYYNDNIIGSLLLVVLAFTVRSTARPDDVVAWWAIGLALGLLTTIKSSGLAYALVVLALAAFCFALWRRLYAMRRVLVAGVVGTIAGVLLLGANPYITNTVRHGHPLYPLAGSAPQVDIIRGNATPEFLARPRVQKLVLSLFSESHSTVALEQDGPDAQVRLKWPGRILRSELEIFFSRTDVRIGGFGPWFSLALCLSVITALAWAWRSRPGPGVAAQVLVWPAAVLASVLAFPEPWWARYVPQMWVLPLLLAAVVVWQRPADRVVRALMAATLTAALVNALLVSALFGSRTIARELDLSTQLQSLRTLSKRDGPLQVSVGSTPSTLRRLTEAGVAYEAGPPRPDCPAPRAVLYADATVCLQQAQLSQYREASRWIEEVKARIGRGGARP